MVYTEVGRNWMKMVNRWYLEYCWIRYTRWVVAFIIVVLQSLALTGLMVQSTDLRIYGVILVCFPRNWCQTKFESCINRYWSGKARVRSYMRLNLGFEGRQLFDAAQSIWPIWVSSIRAYWTMKSTSRNVTFLEWLPPTSPEYFTAARYHGSSIVLVLFK